MKNLSINSKKPHVIKEDLYRGDEDWLDGPIDDVIARLQGIREEALSRGCVNIDVSVYHGVEWEYGDRYSKVEVVISASRSETQAEIDTRRANWKKKSESAKKAAATRKQKQEQREQVLYEKLKRKFGE